MFVEAGGMGLVAPVEVQFFVDIEFVDFRVMNKTQEKNLVQVEIEREHIEPLEQNLGARLVFGHQIEQVPAVPGLLLKEPYKVADKKNLRLTSRATAK
ncbi:MAG: hypothetical protein IPM36_24005 [Lewinellaceae bacterium]|nr:hypothetical protein [Lewinellaceae bacterium]